MSDDPRSPAGASAQGNIPPADYPDDPLAVEAPSQRASFLGRLFGAFGTEDAEAGGAGEGGGPGAMAPPGIQNLRVLKVDDVAVPKSEIVAAPVTIALNDLLAMFREHGFSRILIFRDSLDTPLGLVHLKDLALNYGFGQSPEGFNLRTMLRPLLYVPPSMAIGVLLQQMQQKRIHMAVVIDEYGGVDGLVTLEDLIEQVIGEIEDEHDELESGLWKVERPGQWLIEARADVDDIEAATGLKLELEGIGDEFDSIGGLISLLAGRVPAPGEVVEHPSGARFEVVEGDPRRLKSLRLRFPQAAAMQSDGDPAS